MKKIILFIICMIFITGCADYQELSEINIVNGIAVDYKDDEYIVNFEIIKNEASENSSKITSQIVSAKGENVALAFNEAIKDSNKTAYFKHVTLLVVSEELAKEGIGELVDYMLRDVKMSTTFFTVVTKDPEELFKIKVDNDTVSNYIVDSISSNLDSVGLNNIDIIASEILNKRKDIGLPYIEPDKTNKLVLHDIAYFHEDKMKGIIDEKIYNLLYLKKTDLDFESNDNVVKIFEKNISYDVLKNKVIIKIDGKATIKAINKDINLKERNSYEEIESEISAEIKKEVLEFLEETLSEESDLTSIKDLYYKKYKKERDNVPYEVQVNVKIAKNGSIYEAMND